MKPIAITILLLVFAGSASAGQIYGTLWESGKPVGGNIRVEVSCPGGSDSKATDNYGSYQLFVKGAGQCTFRVYYQNQVAETAVQSYNDPVHNDFNLIRQADGHYALHMK